VLRLVAALAIGWLALLIAAPVLPAVPAAVLYLAGSFICHQRPARSFHLEAGQLPVCARCLGIYAGAALGSLAGWAPLVIPAWRPRTLLAAGLAPTVVTLALEWSGLVDPGNVARSAAGVILGLAAAFVLLPRMQVN
jgi:uncharacterized membrane protein